MTRDEQFTDFARARMPHLFRSAWLLCGDRHRAEDLTQETLAKVYAQWGPRLENPAAYAQTTLVRTWISAQRRRSSHEQPWADVPDSPSADDDHDLRLVLRSALARLEPLDRAVVVLRYLDDVPVDEVGRQLGLSSTAVRSRAMRALEKVRATLGHHLPDLALS
ncbi:MAG TPA: SigE family RNA polymerase sigma factor [Nocardioides sp.]|nr:SigE family RNA polymerase sigma factor [Nocardioides sp.]